MLHPAQQRQLDLMVANAAGAFEQAIDKTLTTHQQIKQVYQKLHAKVEAYNPDAVFGILYGLLLLFFGRNFAITFTILEAFRHGGSAAFWAHVEKLQKRLQETRQQKLRRQDPNGVDDGGAEQRVMDEANELNMNSAPTRAQLGAKLTKPLLSIVAVIKLKLAKYIAMGISLGEDLNRALQRFLLPTLLQRVDARYHDHLPLLITYTCRGVCITLAIVANRYINIVATSVRGAFTIARNVQDLCQFRRYPWFGPESHADFYLICCLLPLGLMFQTFGYHALPAPIRAIFFPTFILEHIVSSVMSAVRHT